MILDRLRKDPDDDEDGGEEGANPQARPWKPGWYVDPSHASVVRWWDGASWTKHTAPNDARAATRKAPRNVLRLLVTIVSIVLIVLTFAATALWIFLAFAMSRWSSNK